MAGLIGGDAAAWLSALLERALPGLALLDLAALEGGGLLPWWHGAARWGVADPAALPPAERALLAGFRHGDGTPLSGFDPPRDAALAAGAPEAWGAPAGRRLVALPPGNAAGPWLAAGAMALARDAPEPPSGAIRVLLLLGAPAPIERLDWWLPEGEAAEQALAAIAGASLAGAQRGLRRLSPRLAALTLLAAAAPSPLALPADRIPRDAGIAGQHRLLLGRLPPRPHRLRLRGAGEAALFLDGARIAARAPAEGAVLEAMFHPGPAPTVLGLAGGQPPEAIEIGAP